MLSSLFLCCSLIAILPVPYFQLLLTLPCLQSGYVPKTPAEMQICFSFASLSEVFLGFWLAVLAHILNYERVMTPLRHLASNFCESWRSKNRVFPLLIVRLRASPSNITGDTTGHKVAYNLAAPQMKKV